MLRVSVTELKAKLSKYLRLVKAGETVEVLERAVPVARLEAIAKSPSPEDAARDRLVRDGVVSPARVRPGRKILETPAVRCRADPVRVLVEERGDR